MNEKKILVTGFERFGGEVINPSEEIVRSIDGEMLDGYKIVGAILPVVFAEAPQMLAALIEQHRPSLVIALGQAGGRAEISIERVAINLIDARIPDNADLQPIDVEVIAHAPAAYYTNLPIKAIVARLTERGIPAAVSLSAGSFVCNQVFYWIAHLLATEYPETRGGFIHVPWLPQQSFRHPGEPTLTLQCMIDGVLAAIDCALHTDVDLRIAGGSTH
jgi:pyroglutamyl-peptidase